MEMKLSFKTIKAKKKANGQSSISIFGQAYGDVDISVNEQGLRVTGANSGNNEVKKGTDLLKQISKQISKSNNN